MLEEKPDRALEEELEEKPVEEFGEEPPGEELPPPQATKDKTHKMPINRLIGEYIAAPAATGLTATSVSD